MLFGLSSLVDLCRAVAAAIVVAGHLDAFGYWPVDTGGRANRAGHDAVVVFFVLSGLVVSYAARTAQRDPRAFAVARLSRLWSVAVPAVLLTLALDAIGMQLDPARYTSWQYARAPLHVVYQWLFLGELWTHGSVAPFSNVPYWSLGYEAWYYVLFFVATYLRGAWRVGAVVAVSLAIGPKLWLLLPAWLAGVWTCRLLAAMERCGPDTTRDVVRRGRWHGPPAWRLAGAALVAGAVIGYAALLASGAQARLDRLGPGMAELLPEGLRPRLGYSRHFLSDWLVAALAAAALLGARLARLQPTGALATLARGGAAASFSLYLVHYPTLTLMAAAHPPARDLASACAALLVVAAATTAFWAAFERRRDFWRRALGSVWDCAARRLPINRLAR